MKTKKRQFMFFSKINLILISGLFIVFSAPSYSGPPEIDKEIQSKTLSLTKRSSPEAKKKEKSPKKQKVIMSSNSNEESSSSSSSSESQEKSPSIGVGNQKFKDSRKLTKKFREDIDDWHKSKSEKVNDLQQAIFPKPKRRTAPLLKTEQGQPMRPTTTENGNNSNVALLNIGVVSKDGKLIYDKTVKGFFPSGFGIKEEDKVNKWLQKNPQKKGFLLNDLCENDGEEDGRKYFYDHLNKIIKQNNKSTTTRLSDKHFKNLRKSIECARRSKNLNSHSQQFFHSEQGVLHFLEGDHFPKYFWGTFFKGLKEKTQDNPINNFSVLVNISSYLGMCRTCADTFFLKSELGWGNFEKTFISKAKKHKFEMKDTAINTIAVLVSCKFPFRNYPPPLKSQKDADLNELSEVEELPPFVDHPIPPRIAHRNLFTQ